MITRNISRGVKADGAQDRPYHHLAPIVLKSENLNHLEPSGPVQACEGIYLNFTYYSSMCLKRLLETQETGRRLKILCVVAQPWLACHRRFTIANWPQSVRNKPTYAAQ